MLRASVISRFSRTLHTSPLSPLSSLNNSPLTSGCHATVAGIPTSIPSMTARSYSTDESRRVRSTTVIAVRKNNRVALIADGQVSQGNCVMKGNAKKVRTLAGGKVIAGFAGSTADAIALFEIMEEHIEKYPGQLMRAAVEMAKAWRKDKYLRKLEAVMIVADAKTTLLVSGDGNVLEPEHDVLAIGSGGYFALSAARGIMAVENNLDAMEIARRAMKIAADICVYTNHNITELELSEEA